MRTRQLAPWLVCMCFLFFFLKHEYSSYDADVSHLVVLEHSELDLLSLVLVLLGGGVGLLLPLLSTTTQPQHQVQGGLLGQRDVQRDITTGIWQNLEE